MRPDKVRTPAALLAFTALLMGKRWLSSTNWDDVLHSACTDLGQVRI